MNKNTKKQKVAVAMSGGVDSSTSAKLLIDSGYEVFGIHMRLGTDANKQMAEEAARKVCAQLGIKFYPINIASVFKSKVIKYFLDSYQKGLTPNPCVYCNENIKFGELLKKSRELGADYLATGHYSRIKREFPISKSQFPNKQLGFKLLRAKDKNKDQSYFLYHLTQDKLARIIFPLGDYVKDETKKIAKKIKLPHLQSESQDICFLEGDHNDFLRMHLKLKKGPIKTLDGKVVGEHQGLPLYTIGQRRGVEIGGIGPFYVARADYKNNTLLVVNNVNDPHLFRDSLVAKNVNWISDAIPQMPLSCQAVIRYRHKPVNCQVKKMEQNKYEVRFNEAQRAIASGQSVVFYNKDEVLGGGIIE